MRIYPDGFNGGDTHISPKVTSSKPTIHNVVILDASTSMYGGKYNNAVEGINNEMNTLKEDKNANYTQTIVEFASEKRLLTPSSPFGRSFNGVCDVPKIVTHYEVRDLAACPEFKGMGASGNTPLYQAAGETILRMLTLKKGEESVIVKIFTDGQENWSDEGWRSNVGAQRLHDLIERVQRDNNFTVTFVGTQFDVEKSIKDLGISRGNTLSYDGSAKGLGETFRAASVATMSFSKKVAASGAGGTSAYNFYANTNASIVAEPVVKGSGRNRSVKNKAIV